MLARDPKAVSADLPDLSVFLLATGARIGEALGLLWSEVELEAGLVAITGQATRVTGEGLVRRTTKSTAGQRVLVLPGWYVEMLEARRSRGVSLEEPVFCDALGGFRDPSNVRRDLRRARAPKGSETRQALGAALGRARRAAGMSRQQVAKVLAWPRTRVELVESGRMRPDPGHVKALSELYGLGWSARRELTYLAEEASKPDDADALDWYHLAHLPQDERDDPRRRWPVGSADRRPARPPRPSLTMDVYMGRGATNRAAAAALD